MCNKELKIHQKKEKKYIYIEREREREREREKVFTCLCWQNIDSMEERKTNIYSKKKGRRRVKLKRIRRDGGIERLRYRVMRR